ncbi:MAG: OmpH family outer membrane protein [Verrucomicrobia bacterium]|nr:OmpH family outer membrane protein [Cytophagales bacterium]
MNSKKIIIALVTIFAAIATQAQSIKVGYVDVQTVFTQLPEVKTANSTMETYKKQLEKGIEDKKKVFEQKVAKAEAEFKGMSEAMQQATQKELAGLQEQMQIASQDAQQQMQKKQGELMKPIEDKIQKAINDVAKENGFTHVLSKEMLLFSQPTDDISNLVLKKLGITPGANTATTPKTPTTTPK